jgi:hypothetical protein
VLISAVTVHVSAIRTTNFVSLGNVKDFQGFFSLRVLASGGHRQHVIIGPQY